jgi:hypothetical protein
MYTHVFICDTRARLVTMALRNLKPCYDSEVEVTVIAGRKERKESQSSTVVTVTVTDRDLQH